MKYELILTGLILFASSCTFNSEEDLYKDVPCDQSNVTYSTTITSILENRGCIGCHTGTSANGSIELDEYKEVKKYIDNGRLMGSVQHKDGFLAMPLGSSEKISRCELEQLENWVRQGAPDN